MSGPAGGWGHPHDCGCTGCTGFQKGNSVARKHGAYSHLLLAPRAKEKAEELRQVVPVRSPADDATIDVLGFVLSQIERAGVALAALQRRELDRAQHGGTLLPEDADDLRRLAADSRGWANVAIRYFDALGLTPTSRARLGLDIARTEDALARLVAEGETIRDRAEQRMKEGNSGVG